MILVIDNYDSFTYNLVHLVGTHTPDIEVFRNDAVSVEEVAEKKPKGILISPGPGWPRDAGVSKALIEQLGPKIPLLGVCLGHQSIGEVFGATVTHAPSLMHGKTSEITHDGKAVFAGVRQDFTATRYHSLVLDPTSLPDSLTVTAKTRDGIIMGVRHTEYPIEGIQFHPESVLTTEGPRMLANWLMQAGVAIDGSLPNLSPHKIHE